MSDLINTLSKNPNILDFLTTKEANQLRLVSKDTLEIVKEHPFNDLKSMIKRNFSDFYKCYPNAIGVYLDDTSYITTTDVQDISKIKNIDGTFGAMLKVLVLIEIYKFQKISISI